MIKLFKYLEPLWLGTTGKISIRRILALVFSIDFIINTTYVIRNWELGKSYSDGAMLLGVEAALIAALLSLTTYSNMIKTKIDDGRMDSNTKEKSTATTPFD
jgi:hypothetical protein